ncbi:MAG: response regulator transcription factor [Clostridia bacterium]|nr:response regulator transcription factor [Clostridia bacterium]
MKTCLVLVVEDDRPVRNLITTTLKANDYRSVTAENGETAVMEAASCNPDIVLLDLGLPDIDGVEVIGRIRSWSNVPIIVISARSEDEDKIEALDAGADDYITKPFSVGELLARLRVAQRRLALVGGAGAQASVFVNGQLRIDYAAGCVHLCGRELHLTPIEYRILCLMAQNVGKVLTHKYITKNVWGSSWENNVGSLRVFMATLRKKLNAAPDSAQYIQTHVGIGYRMQKVDS